MPGITFRRARAAAGSLVFFVIAPVVVAGLIPRWITGWQMVRPSPLWLPLQVFGAALIAAGSLVLITAFAQFVMEGIGTPAPVAPTERLVVGGFYRYVRNPMYLAVLAVIVGQSFLLGQLGLLIYAAVVALAVVSFVRGYEEPALLQQYGAQYEAYRAEVPDWWPRLGRR